MVHPPTPKRPPAPSALPRVVDRVLAPLGCLLTLCVLLGHAAEPFYGHPRTPDLLFFVAMPPALAAFWLVGAWRCRPAALRAPTARRGALEAPGAPLVGAVALVNASLLLACTAAYLADVAAFGEILRGGGR